MTNKELQGVEDDRSHFIKRLAPDYNLLGYSYRLIISEVRPTTAPAEEKKMIFFKKKGTPDIYLKGIGDQKFHRIADENTFIKLFGSFDENIVQETDVPVLQIAEPLYLTSSLIGIIFKFINNLKGKQ